MSINENVLYSALLHYQCNIGNKDAKSKKICQQAAEVLYQQFNLMVKQIAHRYKKYAALEDIIQCGYEGMLEGARMFDLNVSLKALSSYLYRSISSCIVCKCLRFTVGVGRSCSKRASIARAAMEKGESFDEVAARLKWNKKRKNAVACALKVTETCAISPEMEIADKANTQQQIERQEEWSTVKDNLKNLSSVEQNLVALIYKDVSIKEQLEILNMTKHKYKQFRENVLAKLSR